MRKLKLTISYEGTAYVGWQVQPNGVSVQSVLQDAFAKVLGHKVDITAAGRTDAGVHAVAQIAHLSTENAIPVEGLLKTANALLPDDIAVTRVENVDDSFHAIRDAKGKIYRYLLCLSGVRNPLYDKRAWIISRPLDLAAMMETAALFVGKHDFESFRATKCFAPDAIRTIKRIDISGEERFDSGVSRLISITFEGDSFVRHMVRNIVGTIVEAGRGRFTALDVAKIIAQKNRQAAGICAPASGLYLIEVIY
jgi:tRNA pseudouridine38-40 synthase